MSSHNSEIKENENHDVKTTGENHIEKALFELIKTMTSSPTEDKNDEEKDNGENICQDLKGLIKEFIGSNQFSDENEEEESEEKQESEENEESEEFEESKEIKQTKHDENHTEYKNKNGGEKENKKFTKQYSPSPSSFFMKNKNIPYKFKKNPSTYTATNGQKTPLPTTKGPYHTSYNNMSAPKHKQFNSFTPVPPPPPPPPKLNTSKDFYGPPMFHAHNVVSNNPTYYQLHPMQDPYPFVHMNTFFMINQLMDQNRRLQAMLRR